MTPFRSPCPIASTLDLIGDAWSLVLVRTLMFGPKAYSDLAAIPEGIATNILADRLKRLETAGIVQRVPLRPGGRRQIYALTARGGGLVPAVQALARWGEAHLLDRWRSPPTFMALTEADFGDSPPAKMT